MNHDNDASQGPQKSARQDDNFATRLLEAILDDAPDLFHSADGTAYATVEIEGHLDTLRIESSMFEKWLRQRAFELFAKAVPSNVVKDAQSQLSAAAAFNGRILEVHHRVAEYDGKYYIDLADRQRSVVCVDESGYRVAASPRDVKFIRSPGMLPLPVPAQDGDIRLIRPFINVPDHEMPLVYGFLVGALRPGGPYPVLVQKGPQGAAKSTNARMIRAVTDPHVVDLDALPPRASDLAVSAVNSHLLCFDNVSEISAEVSDEICRLSTGGGIRKRKLYTDLDESMANFKRPVTLNSIADVVMRQDLVDRSIFLHMEPIDDSTRRTEESLWKEFDTVKSRVFGGILSLLAGGLRNRKSAKGKGWSRLADFEEFVCAAEEAAGFPVGLFRRAYETNREHANDDVIAESPVALAIIDLFVRDGLEVWQGTLTDLLSRLVADLDRKAHQSRGWPRTGAGMRRELDRVRMNLHAAGFDVSELPRTARRRLIEIRRTSVTTVIPSSQVSSNDEVGHASPLVSTAG